MKIIQNDKRLFTNDFILDRDLILEMLQYEDKLYMSKEGQEILGHYGMENTTSLEGGKTIQRKTLDHFGFDTSDESVKNYRTIFQYYYHSPTNYDKEVMNSVVYFRANKCLYYTTPVLNIGDIIPDCSVVKLDEPAEQVMLKSLLGYNKTLICAFSSS